MLNNPQFLSKTDLQEKCISLTHWRIPYTQNTNLRTQNCTKPYPSKPIFPDWFFNQYIKIPDKLQHAYLHICKNNNSHWQNSTSTMHSCSGCYQTNDQKIAPLVENMNILLFCPYYVERRMCWHVHHVRRNLQNDQQNGVTLPVTAPLASGRILKVQTDGDCTRDYNHSTCLGVNESKEARYTGSGHKRDRVCNGSCETALHRQ